MRLCSFIFGIYNQILTTDIKLGNIAICGSAKTDNFNCYESHSLEDLQNYLLQDINILDIAFSYFLATYKQLCIKEHFPPPTIEGEIIEKLFETPTPKKKKKSKKSKKSSNNTPVEYSKEEFLLSIGSFLIDLFKVNGKIPKDIIIKSLNEKHIDVLQLFSTYQSPKTKHHIIKDTDSKDCIGPLLCIQNITSCINSVIYSMVVNEFLSDNILSYVFDSFGDTWPMFIPSLNFTLLSRVLLHQYSKGKNTPEKIWTKVLSSIEKQLSDSYDNILNGDLLGPEHIQFLLMTFHLISLEERKNIFSKLCLLLKQECNEKPRYLLILSRLIIIIEYLLKYFDHPSPTLQENFEEILLGQVDGAYFDSKPSDIALYSDPTLYHLKKSEKENNEIANNILNSISNENSNLFSLLSTLLIIPSTKELGGSNIMMEYYFQRCWYFLKNISQSEDTLLELYSKPLNSYDNKILHYYYSLMKLSLDKVDESNDTKFDFKYHFNDSLSLIKKLSEPSNISLRIPKTQTVIDFIGICIHATNYLEQNTISKNDNSEEITDIKSYFSNAIENSTSKKYINQINELIYSPSLIINTFIYCINQILKDYSDSRENELKSIDDIKLNWGIVENIQNLISEQELRSILEQFLSPSSASLIIKWNTLCENCKQNINSTIPSDYIEKSLMNNICKENSKVNSLSFLCFLLFDLYGEFILLWKSKDIIISEEDSLNFSNILFSLSNTPLLSIDECKLILSSIISDEKILKIETLNKFNMINSLLNFINSSESNQYNNTLRSIIDILHNLIKNNSDLLSDKFDLIPLNIIQKSFMNSIDEKLITNIYNLFYTILNTDYTSPLNILSKKLIKLFNDESDNSLQNWLIKQLLGTINNDGKHQSQCSSIIDKTIEIINLLLNYDNDDNSGKNIIKNCLNIFDIAFKEWINNIESYFTLLQNLCWQNNMATELVKKIANFLQDESFIKMVSSSNDHLKCGVLLIQFLHESVQLVSPELISKKLSKPSIENEDDNNSFHKKLCTFTETKENYELQHWYNCYTCGMTFSEGICSVCVKVCHKDHDVSYACKSNFFCDCGAGAAPGLSCSAMVPRKKELIPNINNNIQNNSLTVSTELNLLNTPAKNDLKEFLSKEDFGNQIINVYTKLLNILLSNNEELKEKSKLESDVNISMNEKNIKSKSDIIAFKRNIKPLFNLKYNYDGEYGDELKKYVKRNFITRKLLDINSNGLIAIAENNNSISIGTSDKLFDNGKGSLSKKYFNSITKNDITFFPLYIKFNSLNNHYLAVAGIKNCIILTIEDNGNIADQLEIDLSLEALSDNLFILDIIWIPGSQVKLAIVTNQFVKIFDLSKDSISPIHYFTLLEDDVRDVSFFIRESDNQIFMLLLASSSMLFCQELNDTECGPCIMTDVVQIDEYLTGKGGYSIHYSNILDIIIVSFADGTSFAGKLDSSTSYSSFLWTFKLYTADNTDSYHAWVDIPNSPGSIICRSKSDSIVAMKFDKDDLSVQVLPLSDKIEGLCIVPNSISNNQSMICALVGDGSLNRLNLPKESDLENNNDESNNNKKKDENIKVNNNVELKKKLDRKSLLATFKRKLDSSFTDLFPISSKNDSDNNNNIVKPILNNSFKAPIDFFEKVDCITDKIILSGDILLCYTSDAALTQLQSQSGYIVIPNSSKFEVIIENTIPHMVIAGVRILVGGASTEHIPKTISVLDKTLDCKKDIRKWYEFPLSPNDCIKVKDKISIITNGSYDDGNSIVIDSIEVYGLPLEQFDIETQNSLSKKESSDALETSIQLCTDILSNYYKNFGNGKTPDLEDLLQLLPGLLKNNDNILYSSLEHFLEIIISDKDIYNNLKDSTLLYSIANSIEKLNIKLSEDIFKKYLEILSETTSSRLQSMYQLYEVHPNLIQSIINIFWKLYESLIISIDNIDSIINLIMNILFGYSKYLIYNIKSSSIKAFDYFKEFLLSNDDLIKVSSTNAICKFFIKDCSSQSKESIFYHCDGCNELIEHTRWNCEECEDYDLCPNCYNNSDKLLLKENDEHKLSHSMKEIKKERIKDNNEKIDISSSLNNEISLDDFDQDDESALLEMALAMSLNTNESSISSEYPIQDTLFNWLISQFNSIKNDGGKKVIPYMRLLYSLVLFNRESDDWLTDKISKFIKLTYPLNTSIDNRSSSIEIDILTLKILAAFIRDPRGKDVRDFTELLPSNSSSEITIVLLKDTNIIEQLYTIVNIAFPLFKDDKLNNNNDNIKSSCGKLLEPSKPLTQNHLFPLFSKKNVRENNNDLFINYRELLIESALKLTTLLYKKGCDDKNINWKPLLCNYINSSYTNFISKKAKSLLLAVCKSKKQYYIERDFAQYNSLSSDILLLSKKSSNFRDELRYSDVVEFVSCLNNMWETASNRPINWQNYCHENPSILSLFFNSIFYFTEEPVIITEKLLSYCFLPKSLLSEKIPKNNNHDKINIDNCKSFNENTLDSICTKELLSRFLNVFLLEYNNSTIRSEARNVFHWMWFQASSKLKEIIFDILKSKLLTVPTYGRNAAEFFELIGFVIDDMKDKIDSNVFSCLLSSLEEQNSLLYHHPNSYLYQTLSSLVNFDGYYLESEPCLVCNDPEVPFKDKNLSSIACETKYTANTIINRFSDSFTIKRMIIGISEGRKSKMIKTINLYYNNKPVQDAAELRDKWKLWKKVKTCNLIEGQKKLIVDFLIPITASNFLIEFSDFYENLQIKAMEKLQCPRCSQTVTDKHGICQNCRENAYQCHQCRNINYENLTAFLCNECGYCSYASFNISFTSKISYATNKIENDEDRDSAMELLDKESEIAYKCYNEIMEKKKPISKLILELKSDISSLNNNSESVSNNDGYYVNSKIHELGNYYITHCKSIFISLSKSIQLLLGTRRELVRYNNRSLSKPEIVDAKERPPNQCYGCANAFISLTLSLIDNLSNNSNLKSMIVKCGVLNELMDINLLQGTSDNRKETRKVICSLVKNDLNATKLVIDLLKKKFNYALDNYKVIDFAGFIRNEVQLLVDTASIFDNYWEERFKLLMEIFFFATKHNRSPEIVNQLILPCLKYLNSISNINNNDENIDDNDDDNDNNNDKSLKIIPLEGKSNINISSLYNNPLFNNWKKSAEIIHINDNNNNIDYKLIRKYLTLWKNEAKILNDDLRNQPILSDNWLIDLLFCSTSIVVREEAVIMIKQLSNSFTRKRSFLNLLNSKLYKAIDVGDIAKEYFELFKFMIEDIESKVYLTLNGFLQTITSLILTEIQRILHLENTFTSDISQGYVLQTYISILELFLDIPGIRRKFKNDQLMITLLDGFLSIRGVIVQKTKLTDDSADKLINLLKSLHGSNEEDNELFMEACIKALDKHSSGRTPIFIFEQLCNIVCPTKIEPEFLMCLNKSPTQEEFIRGGMNKNPYPSKEIGPLMRDVKNKICRDLDLRGLLEDDNSMELLICDKIIKLDLSVKQVFEKLWMKETNVSSIEDARPMEITYRLQGLDGEATEDIIESLPDDENEEIDPEEKYKITRVMSKCGGLEAMISQIEKITDFDLDRDLAMNVLNLLVHCCKIKVNRQKLLELNCLSVLLNKLKLSFPQETQADIAELLLLIVESIVSEANLNESSNIKELTTTSLPNNQDDKNNEEAKSQMMMFLEKLGSPLVRCNPRIVKSVTRILPVLTYGQEDISQLLVLFFVPYLTFDDFEKKEYEDPSFIFHLDCFVRVTSSIRQDLNGMKLRDVFENQGITKQLFDYLSLKMPKSINNNNDDDNNNNEELEKQEQDEWELFTELKALTFVLPALSGLTKGHKSTQQIAIDQNVLKGLYQLSGMSTEYRLGNFAEGLLESLSLNNQNVTNVIENIRNEEIEKKKEKSDAARKRVLDKLQMQVNSSENGGIGKITAGNFDFFEDLEEEEFCCKVCREGYTYLPDEVLGFYVYSKQIPLSELSSSRKDMGYSTVTNFNIIHLSCHHKAAEADASLKPRKEEWEGAMLRNSSSLCNNIFPVRGITVSEDVYSLQIDNYWVTLSDTCGRCDSSRFRLLSHDLKTLLNRYSKGISFSEDSRGGGQESNINMIPFIIQMGMFILDQKEGNQRKLHEQSLSQFLSTDKDLWIKSTNKIDNVYYNLILSIFLQSKEEWIKWKSYYLERIIIQEFNDTTIDTSFNNDDEKYSEKLLSICKPALLFLILIDQIHNQFKISSKESIPSDTTVEHDKNTDWIKSISKEIQESPSTAVDTANNVLNTYLKATTFKIISEYYSFLNISEENTEKQIEDLFSFYKQNQQ